MEEVLCYIHEITKVIKTFNHISQIILRNEITKRKNKKMGRSGFKGGGLYAQNLQGGRKTVVLAGSAVTTSVEFPKVFEKVPVVIPADNSNNGATAVAYGATKMGFTLKVSSSATGPTTVGWIAYDDTYR